MTYDHIILISLDNLRSDVIAANPHGHWTAEFPGLEPPRTTVLDDLAHEGAFLSNTITPAPYTSASHASYFTGLYPLHHGAYEFYGGTIAAPTIFSLARGQGMRTIMKVDFPIILGDDLGFTRDVDDYLVEDDQGFIDAVARTTRSVSFAHFGGIHVPYGFHKLKFGGRHYVSMVERLESELPPDLALHVDVLTETPRDLDDMQLFLRYKRAIHHFYATARYSRLFDLYLRGLEFFLETRFEPFLRQLRERLRDRRVLLVVFGDHGHTFTRDSFGNFNALDEGVLRVPVILVGDGVPHKLHTRRVRTIDVLPTVLDLAGIPSQVRFDGQSLLEGLRGTAPLEDRIAISQAYTADANDFVAYQRRQLAGGTPEPLRHVLLGEVVYKGARRVMRRFNRYSDDFQEILPVSSPPSVEWVDPSGATIPDPDHRPVDEIEILDRYNRDRRPVSPVVADDAVRRGLRDMGYNV